MAWPTSDFWAPKITPFWQRLPLFFAYPLHWQPLCYTGLLALASLIGFAIPVPEPANHAIAHVLVWLAFTRYAYGIIDETAQGLLTPELHRSLAAGVRLYLPYKQFSIFVLAAFFLLSAAELNGIAFGVALFFFLCALPASLLTLSMTGRFWAALNPFSLVSMMRSIGWPYLGLCAFLLLAAASGSALQGALLSATAPWVVLPTINFVAMYFTLIMFNLMGYVVYQYHELLGVRVSAPVPPLAAPGAEAAGNDAIAGLIAEGKLEEALNLAHEAQRKAPKDVAAQGRYHKLLALTGREGRLLSHARHYLTLLLQRGQGDEAYEVHCAMRALDAGFAPEQPVQLLRLAHVARRRREFLPALALLKGFDKRYPGHPEIPAVYLFAARVLCEDLGEDESARRILGVMMQRYPEHPLGGEGRQLMQALDRLAHAAG